MDLSTDMAVRTGELTPKSRVRRQSSMIPLSLTCHSSQLPGVQRFSLAMVAESFALPLSA